MRSYGLFLSLVAAALLIVRGEAIAGKSTTCAVSVLEVDTRAPISLATVRLEGDTQAYTGLTDSFGRVMFSNLPIGDYHVIVTAPGYKIREPIELMVTGHVHSLRVLAVRTTPRVIAQETASGGQRKSGLQSSTLNPSVYGGVGAAVPLIPNLSSSRFGPLSIHGHYPGDTTATIDGAPVFPAGFQIPTNLLSADIFDSATMGQGVPGAPGGSVDFNTFDPSIDWLGAATMRGSTFGGESSSLLERGTAGRTGVSFVHSSMSTSDALQGETFADTSGLTYSHDATRENSAEAMTIRYPFSMYDVAYFDTGNIVSKSAASCEFWSGGLPCGYGPGNASSESVRYEQFRDFLTMDALSLDVHLFSSTTTESSDMGSTYFLGSRTGFSDWVRTVRTGVTAKADILMHNGRNATLDVSAFSDDSTGRTASYLGPSFLFPVPHQGSTSAHFSLPVATLPRVTVTAGAGWQNVGGTSSAGINAGARYALTSKSHLTLDATTGALSAPVAAAFSVASPSDTTYDCLGGRSLSGGPIAAETGGKTASIRLGFERSTGMGPLTFSLFEDRQSSAFLTATVPLSSVPAALITPEFLAGLEDASASICGADRMITPGNAYFVVGAPAGAALYQGLDFDVPLIREPRLAIAMSGTVMKARAFGLPGILEGALDVHPGSQLPSVTPYRFQTTENYALKNDVAVVAVENFFGGNNAYQSHAFASADVGLQVTRPSGALTIGVQNINGAASPKFNTFDAFPLRTSQYMPRTYSVQYRFFIGDTSIDHTRYLNASQIQPSSSLFFVPVSFEGASHGDWLAVDTASPFCGPELAPAARELLSKIRAYSDEAAATFLKSRSFIAPLTSENMQMSVIAAPSGYAIRISLPDNAKILAPLWKCARLHEGDAGQAKQLGLPIQTWQERYSEGPGTIYYAPQAGLYFSPDPIDETTQNTVSPASFPDPRDLARLNIDQVRCPSTYRAPIENVLERLGAALSRMENGNTAPFLPHFSLSKHNSKAGAWYEILPDSDDLGNAIIQCAAIPSISQSEVAARSLGSAVLPSINYADKVGFYVISQ